MCGFAGFVGNVDDREQVLVNMMNTIIHRGPDSEGKYVDEDAALGFRRLSIIDLSSVGDQPLYNEDKSMVLVFNGEIYNYQELKKELQEAGHTFVSNTDSETLIHGYEEWGESLVERLRGMYAFAIWDTRKKKLFAARDIFGIKPLYYAQMNGTLMFASEIKAFMEHPKFDKVFNEDALGNYLSFQFVPTNETFFKGVFCLQPGHYFTYENGELDITRYFEPNFTGNTEKSFEEIVDDVEAVMKESVAMHKISDVEVASYLSSGVDSSYLTYLGQVDLHIIQMLQTDSMLFRNIQCIPCQMWEIGRMLISSSNSTACPDRIICINLQFLTVLILCVNSPADSIFHNNVCHCSIFVNFHIRKLLHLCKQLTCNFFSCNILMEKDSRSGMGPFSCKCIDFFQRLICFRLSSFFLISFFSRITFRNI